ncbi:MAG: MarR family transcriptional regulator [Bacteroidales bacterium]|nr:MarR family transcriptional regulator [Bacteroidales bacterium]
MYKFEKSLGRISQQVSKSLGIRLENKFRSAGIRMNGAQWSILSMLYQSDCVTQQCVGTTLGMDKVTLTRAVNMLEKRGYLTRSQLKDDRRIKEISLSDEGKVIYNTLAPLAEATLNEAFAGIEKEKVEALLETLEKIHSNLSDDLL